MFSSVSGFHHRGGDPYETGSDTPIPNFIASVSPLLSRVCSGLKNVRSNPADAGRNRSILIYCSTTALRSQEKPQANHGFAAKKTSFVLRRARERETISGAAGEVFRNCWREWLSACPKSNRRGAPFWHLRRQTAGACKLIRRGKLAWLSSPAPLPLVPLKRRLLRAQRKRASLGKAAKFNPSRQMRHGR